MVSESTPRLIAVHTLAHARIWLLQGGAIYNSGGSLTLEGCTFSSNEASVRRSPLCLYCVHAISECDSPRACEVGLWAAAERSSLMDVVVDRCSCRAMDGGLLLEAEVRACVLGVCARGGARGLAPLLPPSPRAAWCGDSCAPRSAAVRCGRRGCSCVLCAARTLAAPSTAPLQYVSISAAPHGPAPQPPALDASLCA